MHETHGGISLMSSLPAGVADRLPDKPIILLVDDMPANLHMLAELLREDYQIKTAIRGADALQTVGRTPPDLILLDVMMPDMNGIEVLRRLRENPQTQNIPVMFISADATELSQMKGLEYGADEYLVKPIQPLALLARVRNLLRRKHAEDALKQLNHELERRIEERTRALVEARNLAEAANRAKSQFLSSMSHELRTPLNAILGYAQLFGLDPALSENARESSKEIEKAGQILLDLIDDVLDLSLIESGQMNLSMRSVQVNLLADECLGLVAVQADKAGVLLTNESDDAAMSSIYADLTRVRQVLMNLLSNAIKYNRPQGTVCLICQPVVSAGALSPDRVRIAVQDTGPGIPADKQARMYIAFDRLGAECGTVQGTGIGLVICKRLVEAMGGVMGFDSTPGQGSCFWVEFPRASNL